MLKPSFSHFLLFFPAGKESTLILTRFCKKTHSAWEFVVGFFWAVFHLYCHSEACPGDRKAFCPVRFELLLLLLGASQLPLPWGSLLRALSHATKKRGGRINTPAEFQRMVGQFCFCMRNLLLSPEITTLNFVKFRSVSLSLYIYVRAAQKNKQWYSAISLIMWGSISLMCNQLSCGRITFSVHITVAWILTWAESNRLPAWNVLSKADVQLKACPVIPSPHTHFIDIGIKYSNWKRHLQWETEWKNSNWGQPKGGKKNHLKIELTQWE